MPPKEVVKLVQAFGKLGIQDVRNELLVKVLAQEAFLKQQSSKPRSWRTSFALKRLGVPNAWAVTRPGTRSNPARQAEARDNLRELPASLGMAFANHAWAMEDL